MGKPADFPPCMDPHSGFLTETKTFYSLYPSVPLPEPSLPLSFPAFALSLLPSPLPSHPALLDAATSAFISFPTFFSRVDALATILHARVGLSRGKVAFILSPSNLDIPILYFALLSLGVAVAPANPAATPAELSHLLRLTNPSIVFAISSTASKLPFNLPTLLLDSPTFRSFLEPETDVSLPLPLVKQSDVAAIQFSSGTTGRVKAAALSHRSLIAGVAVEGRTLTLRKEVALLVGPMFHSMGFMFALIGVARGETSVVLSGRAGFTEAMRAVERHHATLLIAAPPVVVAMGQSEEAERHDLSSLERVICGGAPFPAEAGKRFRERFPTVNLHMGYGLTEGGGVSGIIKPDEVCHLGTCGRLMPNVEAKIVDNETGETLMVGQKGELWIRGPAIMSGYIGDDEANSSTFDSEGYMRTGDLCYIDRNGFLHIVDRLKEMIKYNAYQVSPVELEELIQTLSGVDDAAVIPYPQEDVGQIPMAFVVRKQGSNLNEIDIINFVASQVAPYKKIRRVALIDSIPRSPAGKILRKELLAYALRGYASKL